MVCLAAQPKHGWGRSEAKPHTHEVSGGKREALLVSCVVLRNTKNWKKEPPSEDHTEGRVRGAADRWHAQGNHNLGGTP